MRQSLRFHSLVDLPTAAAEAGPPRFGFDDWWSLPGEELARHRTGHVVRVAAADNPLGVPLVRKGYEYPTLADRRRGLGRNTWLAPSRAAREGRLLDGLARRGLQPALAVLVGHERSPLGVLRRCFLVTRWWESLPLERSLEQPPAQRARALRALARFVAALHHQGFLDRDLHLRNLLWDGRRLVKIDCPRGAFLSAGRHRRAVARDLRDLGRDLADRLTLPERRRLWLRYQKERRRLGRDPSGTLPTAPACPAGTWPAPD